jgi:hypothetical protein
MKTNAAKWILASACAALLAAPGPAVARPRGDSRHPDPRGHAEFSGSPHRASRRSHRPPPPVFYVPPPQPVYYYAPPPPPPPVVYYYPPPPPPPPPMICYPMRPGFNIVFSF